MPDPAAPAARASTSNSPGGMTVTCSRSSAARRAVVVVFLVHALLFASWTAHIPQRRAQLKLTDANLGLALLGAPIGSLAALLVTGPLLQRYGSRRMVQVCLAGYCLTGLGPGMAGSQAQLFAALAAWGAFLGALDVAMNTQGIAVERTVGHPIMSGLHGAWSIGGFSGAGLGALAVAAGISLTGQLLVLGLLAAVAAEWASVSMLPDPDPDPQPDATEGDRSHRPGLGRILRHPVVLSLGLVALACMLCEGGAADWSAVYLHDSLHAGAALAALGYAAFSATMVALRLSGDRLFARAQVRTVLPVLAGVATVGLSAALLLGQPVAALLGFAALGIGVALVVPSVYSAAGRLPDLHAGTAIAAVSALGWIGFVGGPPLIGHLAAIVGLPAALALLPGLSAVIAIATRTCRAFNLTPAEPNRQ